MGGVGTPLAWSEALMGLRQGTVDGISTTYGLGYTLKVYENSKFVSYTKHYYESAPLIISKKFLDAFSPEEQKILKTTAAEALLWSRKEQMKVDEETKANLEKVGQKVNLLTDKAFNAFRERTKPVYEQFRPKIGPEFIDETFAFIKSLRKK
jgi:TRAP-type C4-dicarboxylate transport system substrate-binding protein